MPDTDIFSIKTGGLPDLRTPDLKEKDWAHEEIFASATPVIWQKKDKSLWKNYPDRDQDGSSSCMAQSGSKTKGIVFQRKYGGKFIVFSAGALYRQRINFPGLGMGQPDLFQLMAKPTGCLESQVPSQKLNEEQMNAISPILTGDALATATAEEINAYAYFTTSDIDAIASVIDKIGAVHLMLFFAAEEWWKGYPSIVYPSLGLFSDNALHHGICVVDNYLNEKGEKCLLIEDSAGPWLGIDGIGHREVTEAFLKARFMGAGYVWRKDVIPTPPPAHHAFDFAKRLVWGMKNDPDVRAMQAILQYEGFMPSMINGQPFLPTGNFLGMTSAALKKWQIAHGITDYANENDPTKIAFGHKSAELANRLY